MATESFFSNASLAYLASAGAGKDGKTYSIKPTDGSGDFTFSRGSNLAATRVGPTGLIEKGRENLLLQSNQFDTTWTNVNSSETSGQSGYDGSNNAWLLTNTAGGGRIDQNISSSGVQSLSVYAKANTFDYLFLLGLGASDRRGNFDLTNGVVGTTTNLIDSSIESVGNGWYRCTIIYNDTINQVRVYGIQGDNDFSGTSGSIYIQDAQLEIGLAATEPIESGATTGKAGLLEDEPRFDYSGGATCPSLLLEPSRTNLITQSEYIDSWSKAGSLTISNNNDTSPEGIQNASLILPNAGSGTFGIIDSIFKSASSITYTLSGFAKAKDYNFLILRIDSGGANGVKGAFDLSDGTISTAFSTNGTGFTLVDADIKPYENNWYRYEVSFTTDSLTLLRTIFYVSNVTGNGFSVPSYTANGTDGILFYGAQVELGFYPTSYIPNHSGGSVTRGADVCGDAGTSATFNSTEGVLYFEGSALSNDLTFKRISIGTSDGNFINNVGLRFDNNGASVTYQFRSGNVYQAELSTTINQADVNKLACVWKENRFELWKNGVKIAQDTSGSVPPADTFDSIFYGKTSILAEPLYSKTKQVIVFPTALSNEELETLTTL